VKTQASTTLTRKDPFRGGQELRVRTGLLSVPKLARKSARTFAPKLARKLAALIVPLFVSLFVLVPAGSASARVHHNDAWARQQFSKAERMREALNGRPLGQRTRHEYQRVIDSYRSVYFASPASSKADPSVVASAELMVEMGRRFDDDKILRGAIEQYHFLRKEYPGSKYRFDALFTIGEIYKDDLNDPAEARTTFEDFLRRYPHNRLSDDARAAVKTIDLEAADRDHAARKSARKQRTGAPHGGAMTANAGVANNSPGSSSGSSARDAVDIPAKVSSNAGAGNAALASNAGPDLPADTGDTAAGTRGGLPRVTGVRHWSTPDYTRVAIDVEQEVKFDSQRISRPDRIFFDLRGTRLASTLVGKTFDVDDGFLKKIRVAEFQPGRTRIVLEVDDLSSYDAFLLPDPYRLIIDIHGKGIHGKNLQARSSLNGTRTDTSASDPEASVLEASESDGDSPSSEDSRVEDTKTDGRKTPTVSQRSPSRSGQPTANQQRSNRQGGDKARSDQYPVVAVKQGPVETDLPPGNVNADSRPSDASKAANGIGVIKTTAPVKGTNQRIPKTIVEADDQAPTTLARIEPDKIEPRNMPSGETKATKSNTSRSSLSATSSPTLRHKKTHVADNPADTADLPVDRALETREARPTASGDRSLTRALGLKIGKIVIDAGHGGYDTGTIGPDGLLEKDVVLDVAKRLGRLLESRLGAEVIYTRRDDTFIPLETRTAIANRERADLFISIHANSSHDSDARGVETYYLNFTSSPEALEVAARENAVSEKSIHELQDLVKKIALKEKIDESREFAGDVQESLYGGLSLENAGIRNRGVKKAPFIVLIGANMPSILAEISFVSNPTDERKMETSEHRQRIAESLYRGVSKYVNGLSGVKVASKLDKGEGQ
jgi:N-acetylmuramoyl-L-alanine amidase